MRSAIILQGVSGSGKSTYAKNLAEKLELGFFSKIVSADNHFTSNGVYSFDPTKLTEADASCFRQFIHACSYDNANLVIVDNTNTTPTEIAPYVLGAHAFRYDVKIVRLIGSLALFESRNTHKVPRNTIEKQYRQMISDEYPRHWRIDVAYSRENGVSDTGPLDSKLSGSLTPQTVLKGPQ
jgi:predicted kinase